MEKKEKISLRFNSSIYPLGAIKKAILAYSGFADFKVKRTDDYTIVEARNIFSEHKNNLADEFKNYCLGIIQ